LITYFKIPAFFNHKTWHLTAILADKRERQEFLNKRLNTLERTCSVYVEQWKIRKLKNVMKCYKICPNLQFSAYLITATSSHSLTTSYTLA
jgi:hypothetical protein